MTQPLPPSSDSSATDLKLAVKKASPLPPSRSAPKPGEPVSKAKGVLGVKGAGGKAKGRATSGAPLEAVVDQVVPSGKKDGARWWKGWPRFGARRELHELRKQHQQLLEAVEGLGPDLERRLTLRQSQGNFSNETLAELGSGQRQVENALATLNSHLEVVEAKEARFLDSIQRVGDALSQLRDGQDQDRERWNQVGSGLGKLEETLGEARKEIEHSSQRSEKRLTQLGETEQAVVREVRELQKRSERLLWILGGGFLLVMGLLAVVAWVIFSAS